MNVKERKAKLVKLENMLEDALDAVRDALGCDDNDDIDSVLSAFGLKEWENMAHIAGEVAP